MPSSIFDVPKLKQYLELDLNVLLSGHGGVGKTAIITEVFSSLMTTAERAKIGDIRNIFDGNRFKYFSGPTMDPWVDFVGVPRAVEDKKRGGYVLELVRPEFVKADEVEAIFIDELNRASPKVMNAVMELIQFKSINGHKLKNLKVIWAAINPEDNDGEYDVVRLDRALKDRFHVQIDVPYKLDESYIKRAFPEFGDALITWWNDLPHVVQHKVSPRRVEYIGNAINNNLHLADFLPTEANVSKLRAALRSLPFAEQLDAISTEAAAKAFLKNINNATKLLQMAGRKAPEAIAFYEKYKDVMPQELVDALRPAVAAAEEEVRISTFDALLPELNKLGKIGEIEITRALNKCALVYENGTLQDDVRRQMHSKTPAFSKFVSHMIHVMTKETKDELMKAMRKPEGGRTNFVSIAMIVATFDKDFEFFDKNDRKKINAHTFVNDVAPAKWM